jgi:signal transduction histidine kinase
MLSQRCLAATLLAFPALCNEAGAATSFMELCRRALVPGITSLEAQLATLEAERSRLPVESTTPDLSHAGYRSEAAALPNTEKWVQIDLGRPMPVDSIALLPAVIPSPSAQALATGFPRRFRIELSLQADFATRTAARDFTSQDFPDPGNSPVIIRGITQHARYVRITATRLRGEPDNYFLALGEVAVCSGNRNMAQGRAVTALDALDSPRWSLAGLCDGISVAGRPSEARLLPTNGYHAREESDSPSLQQWVQIDLETTRTINAVVLVPARPFDFPDTIGFGFPVRFRVETDFDPAFPAPIMIADHTGIDFPNPGDRRVILPAAGIEGRYVRITATRLWPRQGKPDDVVFALAEAEVISSGHNVAHNRPVTESAPLDLGANRYWAPEFLVDAIAPADGVGTYTDWLVAVARVQDVDRESAQLRVSLLSLRDLADKRLTELTALTAGVVAIGTVAGFWLVRIRQRRQTALLRTAIARDLHDEIGSSLSSISLLSQLGIDAAPDCGSMHSDLLEIRRVADEAAGAMRDIVWLVNPISRNGTDIAVRLRENARQLLVGMRFTMEISGASHAARLPTQGRRQLLLIFKEALHNIRRHAAAAAADIRLTWEAELLTLVIHDDGCGFDPEGPHEGHGLSNMKQRAETCRGHLRIHSAPGHGTTLTLTLPCP